MTGRLLRVATSAALVATLGLHVLGCDDAIPTATGAFGGPIDFSYACEGVGATQAPENDERAFDFNLTFMCPEIPASLGGAAVTAQGALIGLVLNDAPPTVNLVQMNPAAVIGRQVLDTSLFIPGFTGIDVGANPIRILRSSGWDSFYVISAGARQVTRIVVEKLTQDSEGLAFTTESFDLPGVPSDGVIVGDTLLVPGAWTPELWIFDLAADPGDPPMKTVAMPALVGSLQPLDDDELLATWIDRPVVSRLGLDGTVLVEAGIRPACSDTLDDDGDGLTDAEDPDCESDVDPIEGGGTPQHAADTLPLGGFFASDALPCADGLDNDDDGLTDSADPACADTQNGETLPECSDGIDNDFDGLVDAADESCYGATDLSEGLGGAHGPYAATVVDGGAHGRFVYVLDAQRDRLGVLDAGGDGLERVPVPWHVAYAEPVPYRGYTDGEGVTIDDDELRAQRVTWKPGPGLRGETDLRLPATPGLRMSAGQVRGELWERLITPQLGDTVASVANGIARIDEIEWAPTGCDPLVEDRCYQPALDDQSWLVFLPRADGAIQVVESIRRGVPLHRFLQITTDPMFRATDIAKPALLLRGSQRNLGSNLREGFAFMGPLSEEQIAEQVEDVSPNVFRRYGVWPAEDLTCVAGVCRNPTANGAACSLDVDCAADAWCDTASGLCAARADAGEACTDHRGCGDGLYCSATDALCAATVEAGVACDDDALCDAGLHCDEGGGVCVTDAVAGEVCAVDSDCTGDAYCDTVDKLCVADLGLWAACDRHDQCAEGFRCDLRNGRCVQSCLSDAECASDVESVVSERWRVTYEGTLPGTASHLGRFVQQETDTDDTGAITSRRLRFYDPKVRFCERGAQVGDWLTLEAAPTASDPALRYDLPVVTEGGVDCPTEAPELLRVEAPIVEVGDRHVVVEATAARLRPVEPVLDEEAIDAAGLVSADCENAQEALVDELTWPERLLATDALEPGHLPRYLSYTVRPDAEWTVFGSRSGYLHRWRWDSAVGACVEDEALDARFAGRVPEVELPTGTTYSTCPPGLDDIGFETVVALLPDGWRRFTNWSFSLDLFPGCRNETDGSTSIVPTQRDTQWLFDMAGPDSPNSVSADGVLLGNRVPLFDARRQQVQLDTATGRVHLLQIRANGATTIATFE